MACRGWSLNFMDAEAIGVSSTAYSKPLGIGQATGFSMHLEWVTSGGVTANTVWTSNKNSPGTSDDTDWVQETAITVTGPNNDDSKTIVHLANVNSRWIRLKFVENGSGVVSSISGWAHLKD